MTFQVDRTSANPIEHAAWSPTMDLLALSYHSGEFSVVRTCMSWQAVWTVKEEGEGDIQGLVWRSDGKVLAVNFKEVVNLYSVEGGTLLHSSSTQDSVVSWCSLGVTSRLPVITPVEPHLPQIEDVKTDIMSIRDLLESKTDLNVMLLCDKDRSCLRLAAQGMLHIGSVPASGIASVGVTPDGKNLCVVTKQTSATRCTVYNTESLAEHTNNINDVTMIYSKVLTLSEYLLSTFKAMTDSWDDVLSEFNKKLFAFHMSLHPSNLSEQFLHLLVTGTASMDLENFLVHTLKEKEISKLLQSTMQSYKGIEKLITQNFMCCCYALATHLQFLLGMSRWYDKYGELGLKEASVQDSINKLAGLMIKAQEMLQCITHSKAKLSSFLKWLLKATISLSDGNSSTVKLSEDELNLVVKFLKTGNLFSTRADTSHFNIDTVWQYFSEENILVPPEYYNNKILDTVLTLLKDKKPYLTVQPNLSLVQSHKLLTESLLKCFELNLRDLDIPSQSIDITSLYTLSSDAKLLRYVNDTNIINMISISEENMQLSNQNRHTITDKIISIFGYDRDFILVTKATNNALTICICFEDDIVKTELPQDTQKIFISENRRLGAIISSQGRRIQILDLEEDNGEE
ncbi:hypothetical protein ACHWQZ_G004213 [Mnemiopsis leidyi]